MTRTVKSIQPAATPVRVDLEDIALHGDLVVPEHALGLVIFVHGSGSSRFSPRNKYVAGKLNNAGLATLLLDLLTDEEQRIDTETMEFRFNIPLLGARSTLVASWASHKPELSRLPIGLFGASTGAAAALITAAAMKGQVAAVVSRGGRADMAEDALDKVECPTLLIVGGDDESVVELNEQAMARMHCPTKLHIVPGATHLFEEPGTLEQVATVAAEWFVEHMLSATSREEGSPRKRPA